jgi:hypothetical protein
MLYKVTGVDNMSIKYTYIHTIKLVKKLQEYTYLIENNDISCLNSAKINMS